MKIIDYTHSLDEKMFLSHLYNAYGDITDDSRMLFFDIETTGLSARNSTLYLIGALWYENDTICIRQWFNDDGYTESELISSFDGFCSSFTHLIHFNGTTFDVPYLREKAIKHALTTDHIDSLIQLDIYKEIRSYKKILGLENMKQTTIEKFLGITREDQYSGGELINIYQRYVARPDDKKEHLLLLHNHDDLLGMPYISRILNYKSLFKYTDFDIIDIQNDEENISVRLSLSDNCFIPKRYAHTNKNGVYINTFENNAIITIPVIYGSLKHYFKDYRNYYYLPKEDMAIHKSVATYVDPNNRQQASKSNCYIIKNDRFIICPDRNYSESFQKDIKDTALYRTCSSFINSSGKDQWDYINALLKSFL